MKEFVNNSNNLKPLLRRGWGGLASVNWGIIGCGNVTELKSGPAFNKVEHSRIVAVMRRNAVKAADYAQRHGIPKWYSDANQLINDPQVNAVYIATPPDTHASYAIQAMRAGKPVYVEKPMARNYQECQEMIRVSKETGMPLFVAYYRRSLPAFLKVKELIFDGIIGKPLTVNIRLHKSSGEKDQFPEKQSWHVNPEIAGAGYFYDLASHQFDFLDFVFGPISEVHGIAKNLAGFYTAEDTVSAAFAFDSGVSGTGSWCFVVPKGTEEDIIEITGTKGEISFSSFQYGDVKLTTPEGTVSFSFQNPENIQHYLIRQVVQELRGEAKCVSTGYSAAHTSWVLEEIVKGYYNG
ncbi:MAG: Gfo/Idh/MocA family oxidoreductase [Bacteroidota bacterium]|nr:oxidoreductase [Odoribacter sp.]MDP3643656.1 Gfo/Idh/MocA family oxidoreductase [Bacteroidota bacterium]